MGLGRGARCRGHRSGFSGLLGKCGDRRWGGPIVADVDESLTLDPQTRSARSPRPPKRSSRNTGGCACYMDALSDIAQSAWAQADRRRPRKRAGEATRASASAASLTLGRSAANSTSSSQQARAAWSSRHVVVYERALQCQEWQLPGATTFHPIGSPGYQPPHVGNARRGDGWADGSPGRAARRYARPKTRIKEGIADAVASMALRIGRE